MSQIRTRAQIEREAEIRAGRHLAPPPPETRVREKSATAPVQSLADALCPDLDQQIQRLETHAAIEYEGGEAPYAPE